MRPRPRPPDLSLPTLEGYEVARVPSFRAVKEYLCPACGNPIPPGLGHVVVWAEDLVDERRHWHVHCWRIAVGRGRVT